MGAYLYWNKCTQNGVAIPDRSAAYEVDVTDPNVASPFVYAHGVADATRPLYCELVAAGLMEPLHTFALGPESAYRLTDTACDLRDVSRVPSAGAMPSPAD